jgi:hypothetical protein
MTSVVPCYVWTGAESFVLVTERVPDESRLSTFAWQRRHVICTLELKG